MPVDAGEADHCGTGEQLMHLHEFAIVHDATDHIEHVVGLPVVFRYDVGKPSGYVPVGPGRRIRVGRRCEIGVRRQVGEHRARIVDRIGLILAQIVGHAGGGVVHMAATQILHADHLAGGRLDHIRTGDEHVGVLASHDD